MGLFCVLLLAGSWGFVWWDARQHNKELRKINKRLRKLAHPEETVEEAVAKDWQKVEESWKS